MVIGLVYARMIRDVAENTSTAAVDNITIVTNAVVRLTTTIARSWEGGTFQTWS